MPVLSIAAHLPLLRLAGDAPGLAFHGYELWRMPFEVFDALSLGAFHDHRAAYMATDPLFLRLDLPLPEDQGLLRPAQAGTATPEMKFPVARWAPLLQDMGLGLLPLVHDRLIDRFTTALALVAPCSRPVPSRWSCSFVQAEDGHALMLGGMEPAAQLRVQGDADLETLFRPEACNAPLDPEQFQAAADLLPVLEGLCRQPELDAALQALSACGIPTLRADDADLIAATALEALLLPELRSGLAAQFAARAAPLLGGDAALAAALYEQRSASRHGQTTGSERPSGWAPGLPLRALAAGLRSAVLAQARGCALPDWRPAPDPVPLPTDEGAAAPDRITPEPARTPITMRIASHGLRGSNDALVAVLPLVGLDCAVDARFDLGGGIALQGIPASAAVALEDKDIARDFLSQLHVGDLRLAALQVGRSAPPFDQQGAALRSFQRPRELAVLALRLAGFTAFVDPELAGLHALHGTQLLRHPSALRQTVLMRLRQDPGPPFGETDAERVRPLLELLLRYDDSERHADIERWLRALRRVHQGDFLPTATRLGLAFTLLEGLLGRFRDPADPLGPEHLAQRLPGGAASAAWLAAHGRGLRNALAHGRDPDPEPDFNPEAGTDPLASALARLQPLLHAALPLALEAWLAQPDRTARPTRPARLLRARLVDAAPPAPPTPARG